MSEKTLTFSDSLSNEIYDFQSELRFSNELLNKISDIHDKYVELSTLDKKSDEFFNLKTENKGQTAEIVNQLEKENDENQIKIKEIISQEITELKEKRTSDLAEIKRIKDEGISKATAEFDALSEEEKNNKKVRQNFKNSLKGVEIVAKRSTNKVNDEFDYALKTIKLKRYNLHHDYANLKQIITGHRSMSDAIVGMWYENVTPLNFRAIFQDSNTYVKLVPYVALLITLVVYYAVTTMSDYEFSIGSVLETSIFVALVSTGAVFIYSGGSFDMSLGNSAAICFLIAAMVYNATHSVALMFLVTLILGAVLGIINSVLASMLNLPVMVMTLTMMNILSAIYETLSQLPVNNNQQIQATGLFQVTPLMEAAFLVGFFLLCWAIFNYTKIGRRNKYIGSNARAAQFSGVNVMKSGVISFAISGIGIALAGIVFASLKSNTVITNPSQLTSVGLNVIIAITLGGMTTKGGPRSKISCAVVGALFLGLIDQIFNAIGNVPALTQIQYYKYIVKGVFFLAIALINMWSSRPKMLAS